MQYIQHTNCNAALNKGSGTKLKGQFNKQIIKTFSSTIRHDLLLFDNEKSKLDGVSKLT